MPHAIFIADRGKGRGRCRRILRLIFLRQCFLSMVDHIEVSQGVAVQGCGSAGRGSARAWQCKGVAVVGRQEEEEGEDDETGRRKEMACTIRETQGSGLVDTTDSKSKHNLESQSQIHSQKRRMLSPKTPPISRF